MLWPQGGASHSGEIAALGGLDAVAPAIGLAAALALFRFKAGVIPVIAGCGIAGLAVRLALG